MMDTTVISTIQAAVCSGCAGLIFGGLAGSFLQCRQYTERISHLKAKHKTIKREVRILSDEVNLLAACNQTLATENRKLRRLMHGEPNRLPYDFTTETGGEDICP